MKLVGNVGVANAMLVFFFESAIFPTTFAICLRGLGSFTKTGSAFLIAASSGGAISPAIITPILQSQGQAAWCVIVAAFSFVLVFSVYLNVVPAVKKQVDPVEWKTLPSFSAGSGSSSSHSRGFVGPRIESSEQDGSRSSETKHIQMRRGEIG